MFPKYHKSSTQKLCFEVNQTLRGRIGFGDTDQQLDNKIENLVSIPVVQCINETKGQQMCANKIYEHESMGL